VAAKLFMLIHPLTRLVLVARTMEKATYAKEQVRQYLPSQEKFYLENLIPLECDQSSIQSVQNFALDIRKKLDETYTTQKWLYNGIDVLCLNAAVLMGDDSKAVFTEDGLETTFQVNHLAPYLIARLTEHMLNPGARVIFSTSGLHIGQKLNFHGMIDPTTGHVRKGFEMMDGSNFHFKQSYSISKLCNVAVCAHLNRRLQAKNKGMLSNCFSPGLMTTSGLFRNQTNSAHPIPEHKRKTLRCKEKTVEWGAGSLVYMALANETGIHGGEYWRDESMAGTAAVYGKEFFGIPIMEDTIEQSKQELLWMLSSELAGIPVDIR